MYRKKELITKAAEEKEHISYQGSPLIIPPNFSLEIIKARTAWAELLQNLKEQRYQPRIQNSSAQNMEKIRYSMINQL